MSAHDLDDGCFDGSGKGTDQNYGKVYEREIIWRISA